MAENSKITLAQTSKKAIIYVRQSTMRQVKDNEESTRRQYAFKNTLIGYGWPEQLIEVIDEDLGLSGKYAENRTGFQHLIAEVANAEVGCVAMLETSRLSRNSSDWGRIIDFCALTNTVIIEENGVYDPRDPNDRLLLGVKGSISEMELHYIRSRMQGGLLNKAKRGDLKIPLPIGYVYDPLDRIVMDPNKDVQETVHLLFKTFAEQGSVNRTVLFFREHNLQFPHRVRSGAQKGETVWTDLTQAMALFLLHHPVYCGRYTYGKTEVRQTPLKRSVVSKDEDDWTVNIPNHHPAYITEEEFVRNRDVIARNSMAFQAASPSAPGRGAALLQGVVYCGRCGRKMAVEYQMSASKSNDAPQCFPIYTCRGYPNDVPRKTCSRVNGTALDRKVSEMVMARLNEQAITHALEIRDEVKERWHETESALKLQAEQAEYESNLMRRRYMQCDPDNALVRMELEKAYNETLTRMREAHNHLIEEQKKHDEQLQANVHDRLNGLIDRFDTIWEDPNTDMLTKKRLIHIMIRDVTLTRINNENRCQVQIVFAGGETENFSVHCTFYGPEVHSYKVYDYLEENGTEKTASELATELNSLGLLRAAGKEWTAISVAQFMSCHKISTKKQHYLDRGYLNTQQVAEIAGITPTSIRDRVNRHRYDDYVIWVTDHMMVFDPRIVDVLVAERSTPS